MNQKYKIEQSLASGSTGKVKMAKYLNKTYAIKIIDKDKKPDKEIRKEIKIHSLLNHKNIVKLIDNFDDINNYYIVMDLAEMELFDLIEPDEGLHPTLIHFYFRQLLSAVEYLHKKGIVHRDIKPENIMLNKNGDLLLTDFGFSTLFMYNNKKRILNSLAGSYSYMAPEILEGAYDDKVDIWSMGILLLVMFTGMKPWSKPISDDENFMEYLQMRNHNYLPFSKLSPSILKLFKSMCCIIVENRISIFGLKTFEWLSKPSILENEIGLCKNQQDVIEYLSPKIITRTAFSQPERKGFIPGNFKIMSSQPNFKTFDLPDLKRIYLNLNHEIILKHSKGILDSLLIAYTEEMGIILFNTVDKSGNEIIGEVVLDVIGAMSCILFTRIKGDCIEFKKLYNTFHERILFIANAYK